MRKGATRARAAAAESRQDKRVCVCHDFARRNEIGKGGITRFNCVRCSINEIWWQLIDHFVSRLFIFLPAGIFLPRAYFPCRVALSSPCPEPLRAQRDRESGPLEPNASHRDTCLGVQPIMFLRSVFRNYSLHLLPRIVPGGVVFFLRLERLLPGGHSRDYTANIFLHRLWSVTSSNVLCQLVRLEPLVLSALVPPLGTSLIRFVYFSVYLSLYLQCLSLVWVAVKLHTCTYMPPLCWLYFFGLNQTLKYLHF